MKLAIFCDFDDTITRLNVTDTVLERFAHPSWLEIQEEWLAGKLTAREVLVKQMPLITVQPAELDRLIDAVEVDPFFAEFARHCARETHALYILSDGFDYWVQRILRRALSSGNGAVPELPVFACGLRLEEGKAAISFPYFPEGCAHGCATCKPALFAQLRQGAAKSIVIGDGVSDLLLAREADLVLAKNGLREFCEREGIASRAIRDFRDALKIIERLKENPDD